MAPRELVRDAVERVVLSGHEGKSGTDVTVEVTDEPCERLSLLATPLRFSPDAAGHPEADICPLEQDELEWWFRQSPATLEEGAA